ncbi:MAG: hypothetical protein ACI9KE_005195 [Polyangiales bacterium]|jgi:hypothetical protein
MRTIAPFALLILLGCLQACGGGARLQVDTQSAYYLQTNLRLRGRNATSINNWRSQTVLPVCTPVQILEARGKRVTFTANGQSLRYTVHRSSRLPLEIHLQRLFGTACPNTAAMSAEDQTGVQQAQPFVGMTRAGVISALGYPPDHRTPNLEDAEWTYWGQEGNVVVIFNGDFVAGVRGEADEPAVMNSQAASLQVQPGMQPGVQPQVQPAPATDTVLVTDPSGYPTRVPRSEINRACNEMAPCHEALICITGTCQAS